MRQGKRDSALEQGAKPRGEYEVLDQNIRGHTVQNDESEVNNIIPTGNLTTEEHRLLLRYQDLLEGIRRLEEKMNIELDIKDRVVEKINFLVHSSKSIDGFGIEKIATKEIREESRVTHRRGDQGGQSMRDQVQEYLGGGGQAPASDAKFMDDPDMDAWG